MSETSNATVWQSSENLRTITARIEELNILNETYDTVYFFPTAIQKKGFVQKILYPVQISFENKKVKIINVNYVYVDITRITKIDIGKSIWSCEFFLDIVTKDKNPLETIKFNNLSLNDSKFETKFISMTNDKEYKLNTFRYFVVANFDFFVVCFFYKWDKYRSKNLSGHK